MNHAFHHRTSHGLPCSFLPGTITFLRIVVLLLIFSTTSTLRAQTPPKLRSGTFKLSEADKSYWAYQKVVRPALPSLLSSEKVANPIDAFLLAELERQNIQMNSQATPRELIRRAFFDLIGLPPTPEEVAAFEADHSDTAWKRLIDDLLARPQYGERWGRHWLDRVRYAESNGYERDGPKPHVWRYRDYVIQAYNQDKPYDQFIREQLAGDLLFTETELTSPAAREEWKQALIATGFYRLHVWDDEPDSTVAAEYDDLDDIMVTTGSAFLGMTIGCARCHDHKFDPVSQADYYAMLTFFRTIDPYGQHKTGGGGRGTGKIERPLATPSELASWQASKNKKLEELREKLKEAKEEAAKKELEQEIKALQDQPVPFEHALAATERDKEIATFILARGDPTSPTREVKTAFPSIFNQVSPGKSPTSRRDLADWIANPENPLTARVAVNHLWQHHFGIGLVPTSDDFGLAGVPPLNQKLLDYLASELVSNKWSIKQLHRLIMTSTAYRMSSQATNEAGLKVDEANRYLWRQNMRRAEAEVIRDSILHVSGELNLKAGGPSVYPTLPHEVHTTQDAAGKGWTDSPANEQNRRSVYLVVKRALRVPLLECFDAASSASPIAARSVTTTAPQALTLMNDVFVQKQAEAFAIRLRKEAGPDILSQITRAYQLTVQRDPTDKELKLAEKFVRDQQARATDEGRQNPNDVALYSFCRAALNLNEMIYID